MLRITIFGGVTYGKARAESRIALPKNQAYHLKIGHATPQKLIVFIINQYYPNHPVLGVVLVLGIAP